MLTTIYQNRIIARPPQFAPRNEPLRQIQRLENYPWGVKIQRTTEETFTSSNSTESADISRTCFDERTYQITLSNWIAKAPTEEERSAREEAAGRIKTCHETNSKKLDFSGLKITTLKGSVLPPHITELDLSNTQIHSFDGIPILPNLKTLDLSYNQIHSFEGMPVLPNLEILDLSRNGIHSFRGMPILPRLFYLCIYFNQITSFEDMPILPELMDLDLSYNQIRSFQGMPDLLHLSHLMLYNNQINSLEDMPILPRLYSLNLSYNNYITSLPENLALLPATTRLNTEGCHLDDAANSAFQNAIDRARRVDPSLGPQWNTTIYEQTRQTSNCCRFDLDFFQVSGLNFDDDQKDLFNQFLEKIQGTADFNNQNIKPNLIHALEEMLQAASSSAVFKDDLFALIIDSLESCSDRTAITLNRIDLQRRIDSKGIDPELLIGYRRLQLLHEATSKIIQEKNLGDAIEPMLYLQIKLKDALNLPIMTSKMLYEGLAQITDEELEQIKEDILNKTSTDEQKMLIFTQIQENTYSNQGTIIAVGGLSPTNPFLADISKIWEKILIAAFPVNFKKIEPKEDEDFTDLKTTKTWEERKKELIRYLTSHLLFSP